MHLKVSGKWPPKWLQSGVSQCLYRTGLYETSTEESLTGSRSNSLFFPSCLSGTGDLNHIKLWKWSQSKSVACPWTIRYWCCHSPCVASCRVVASVGLCWRAVPSCTRAFITVGYFVPISSVLTFPLVWEPDRIHKVTQEVHSANLVVFKRKKAIETY